jgi:hypothetical protein
MLLLPHFACFERVYAEEIEGLRIKIHSEIHDWLTDFIP